MAWLNAWMLPILDERELRRLRRASGNDNAARATLRGSAQPRPVPWRNGGPDVCRLAAAPTPSR
ncbi:hypothetical protein HL658_35430 [Azospirillum sp. RWY-5-1]|uniref:Uncharacterized protein n=1 Tax=Azospirillum oleiclasticum TaxID=2735135 RepID=A0ABX2TMZ1_9PROT|nr:hypothetical protein [Azospirillum oleiclasticum]NYZ17864.1 hypothetical protein [Azospirillum oleiclasticum]NYZ25072.1 hypothetical protein [Azospirillum oleiclasticum]